MRIDVVSDVVCPWCFIGKRQLESAVQAWCDANPALPVPEVVWHPFQLNPVMPPEGIAREYAYTGARMPASEALQYGLVNRVFPDHASLLEGVMGVARQIATRSPLAIWGTKEMVNFTRDHSVADSLRYMAGWQSGMFQPGDMVEEMVAKGERRDPSFEELPTRPTGLGG